MLLIQYSAKRKNRFRWKHGSLQARRRVIQICRIWIYARSREKELITFGLLEVYLSWSCFRQRSITFEWTHLLIRTLIGKA